MKINRTTFVWMTYEPFKCIKIVDAMTQKILEYEKLPSLTQLDSSCHCYNYLRTNSLLCYPNVIAFQSLPYRMPSFSSDRSTNGKNNPLSKKPV